MLMEHNHLNKFNHVLIPVWMEIIWNVGGFSLCAETDAPQPFAACD